MYSTNCTLLNTGGHTCSTQSHNCTVYTLAYYTRGSTCGTTLPNFTLLHIESSKCGTSSPNCTPCHAGGSTSGTVPPGILFCILEAVRAVLYPPTSTVQCKRQYQRHSTTAPVRRVAFQKLHSTVFLFNLLFHSLPFSLSLCIFSKAVYRVGSTSG